MSLSVTSHNLDAFGVHLDSFSDFIIEHLCHAKVLLSVLLRVQLDRPLNQLLCFLCLTELNQQLCVLVNDNSVIWESPDAFVVQSNGLF